MDPEIEFGQILRELAERLPAYFDALDVDDETFRRLSDAMERIREKRAFPDFSYVPRPEFFRPSVVGRFNLENS